MTVIDTFYNFNIIQLVYCICYLILINYFLIVRPPHYGYHLPRNVISATVGLVYLRAARI